MAARKKPDAGATPATPGETRDRLSALGAVATRFEAWRPATEVLTRVSAVPTRFIQVDRGTRVSGWPIERFATIHGPSNHGKTAFCHGLGLSFLERGHFYAFVDAEMTTPETWLTSLMRGQERNPGFVALRPKTFEETVDSVRSFCETVAEARIRGDLPADTTGLIVVDSIKKLVPHRLMEKIAKEGAQGKKGSVDGMGGRAAQYRAALVSQWLDEMIPLLHSTKMGMVVIAREAQDPTADANDVLYDRAWKVQGGGSVIYDASVVARITRASWVHEGSDKEEKIVGERHKVSIWKTKVGGKAEETIDVFFHTSNGQGDCPEGFDPARDLLETALDLGVFELGGSWYSFDGKRWQGAAKVLRTMRAEPEMMLAVDAACRAKFGGSS